jgi:hypothetical protein
MSEHSAAHGGDHGHGEKKEGPEKKVLNFLAVISMIALLVIIVLAVSHAQDQEKAKVAKAQEAEREALLTTLRVVVDPDGKQREAARVLEVRPGRPRHHSFTAPGEVVVVRYLGEYPGYRDDDGEDDAGVWVDFSGLGIGWKLDKPGSEDGIASPRRINTSVLFAGRKKGQTLTFSVLR